MRPSIIACLIAAGLVSLSAGATPAQAQGGNLVGTIGPPLMPATPAKPLVTVLYINGVRIQAVVTTLPAQNKLTETDAQASQRKAAALLASINAAINAEITKGTLAMGTPLATLTTQPATIVLKDKNGNPIINPLTLMPFVKPNVWAGYATITVPGVTLKGDPKDFKPGPGDLRASNPTGEVDGSRLTFPPPAGGTGVKGAMTGTGSTSGLATGMDLNGLLSSVSFGFFFDQGLDATCTLVLPPVSPCPGTFIATIHPTAGETDAQVLGDLAALFNSQFAAEGLTATYDSLSDTLSLDQLLTSFESLFTQNTDPGLDLNPVMGVVVPEPGTTLLLCTGLIALRILRGRRTSRA